MEKIVIFIFIFAPCRLHASEKLQTVNQLSIPVHPTKETIYQEIVLAGNIEPYEFADVRTGWDTLISSIRVQTGDLVKKDTILATVDTKSVQYYLNYYALFLSQIVDGNASNRRQFNFLQKRLRNLETLLKKGTIAIKTLEDVEKETIEFQKSFLATNQQIKNINSQIAELKRQAGVTQIKTPLAGVVSHMIVDPKQIQGAFSVDPGAVFATIQVPGSYKVRAFAFDFQIGNVKENMPCVVSWGEFSEKIICKISSIDQYSEKNKSDREAKAKDTAGRFLVWATFSHNSSTIPANSLAKVTIQTNKVENVLTVPWNAVQVNKNGSFVQLIDKFSGQVEKKIVLGRTFKSRVNVLGGLKENDIIISRFY